MISTPLAFTLITVFFIIGIVAGVLFCRRPWRAAKSTADILQRHFSPMPLESLAVTERTFPSHVRPDLQRLLDEWELECEVKNFTGVTHEYAWMGLSFASLIPDSSGCSARVSPGRREDVDIGEDLPVPCLGNGLWTFVSDGMLGSLFMTHGAEMPGQPPTMRFALATCNDEQSADWSQRFFSRLEAAVASASSYRGKVVSFEQTESYTGTAVGLKVHQLREVSRDQVILPTRTLALLERNVLNFTLHRSKLAKVGLSTKKGLLFHGPPGTGKTHTIHYLAKALPKHTTLVITAEQVQFLSSYMTLARLLQPSVVVMEDADLIARNRDDSDNPCAEAMLNKLLNEMDGLGEDGEVLFILTTNRPDALEPALAARPGRVDQAIEFPLPDIDGRRKLIELYSSGLEVSDDDRSKLAERTEGVSAAFIKELMRRSMQYHLEHDESPQLTWADISQALDEMLVHGGKVNLSLLGATVSIESQQ